MSTRLGVSVCVAALTVVVATQAFAQPQAAPTRVTWGGYVDAYLAYDAGRPATFDRGYTTQAARANEFNVNLAFLEAVLTGERTRGRVALQVGTSVQANYAGEPTLGTVSGAALSRHIQEAYAGVRLAPALWLDAGVFFSNVGSEGWISHDNLAYTRSLIADFSPYYSSGVRLQWQARDDLAIRVDAVNGWQNISETNEQKSLGTRIDWRATPRFSLSHYSYIGAEAGLGLRVFQGIGVSATTESGTTVLLNVDVGRQAPAGGGDPARWHGGALQLRRPLSSAVGVTLRGEWYADPEQVVIVPLGGASEFRATGGSAGLDVALGSGVSWRSEVRLLSATENVFADRAATSGFSSRNLALVSALTLRF